MADIVFDISRKFGKIKPIWGVNSGPANKVFTFDSSKYFREASIPSVRLHDVEYPYGSGEFIDIPCIFKDFEKNETDPENYNFALSDLYIEKIRETGAEVFFRLGVSIEHAPIKRHIYPPKDYAKWARICEHIIRHYNEGFANGHKWNIRYWEIWNEADGGDNMWLGTPEEFYELYATTAYHLKKCFPDLKIGGAAFTNAKNKFTEGFFEYIKNDSRNIPLDFYSWHRYFSSIDVLKKSVAESEELLQKYGFTETENIFDEWNYMESWLDQGESYKKLTNHIGASYCGAVLSVLQKSSVDMAHYFEADVSKEWCGLFEISKMAIGKRDKAIVSPRKPFYAFLAFSEIAKRENEIHSNSREKNIYTVASSNRSGFDGMISLYGSDVGEREISFIGFPEGTVIRFYLTDKYHTNELVKEFTVYGESASLIHPFDGNELYALKADFPKKKEN